MDTYTVAVAVRTPSAGRPVDKGRPATDNSAARIGRTAGRNCLARMDTSLVALAEHRECMGYTGFVVESA